MKKILYHIFLLLCIAVFCISAYKLYGYYKSYKEAKDTYEKIKKDNVKKTNGDRTIDFDKLRAKNPDIVGWVYAKGTGIDYPIVQGKDNEEYLHMDYNKKKSSSGTIFLDHGCDKSFISDNNIIYGHHMKNGTMFAQLLKYKEQDFFEKYPYFSIYTPDGKESKYQIFVAGVVEDTAVNYQFAFQSDEEFLNYIETIKGTSLYTPNVEIDAASQIVTLSTCTNVADEERFVVQAVKVSEQ
mgnify:CR=1 FL=1